MDKIAANNHIVCLRKEIKHAKAMVSGNLIRKIKELKTKKDKLQDDAEKKRIDGKIERIFSETKLIHPLDSYPIAKSATLKPDKKIWEELLSNNVATPEERLTCRIILKNNIQRCVTKFRTEHPDCDEWIEEYFEYREKKKELEGSSEKKSTKKKFLKENSSKNLKVKSKGRIQKPAHPNRSDKKPSTEKRKNDNRHQIPNKDLNSTSMISDKTDDEPLHPSWASKRREKEILKAALAGGAKSKAQRILLSNS